MIIILDESKSTVPTGVLWFLYQDNATNNQINTMITKLYIYKWYATEVIK